MNILMGHLIGDYLLPFTGWMAKNKTKNTLVGWIACLIHAAAYTATLVLFVGDYTSWKFLVIFGSHFVLDKNRIWVLGYMKKIVRFWWPSEIPVGFVILYDNIFHLLTGWILYANILHFFEKV